jgi:hypothetical protein
MLVFDAGYFTFLISMRSLLCSFSFAWSSFDRLGAASSLLAAFGVAASAFEKLGTASASANPIIHPMFNLRIE